MASGRFPELGGLSAPVANADLATMAALTAKANLTGSTAVPADATMTALLAALMTGNTSTTTRGTAGTSIVVGSLDGNVDGDYLVYFHLVGESATGVPSLQINGADTNLYSSWVKMSGASTVAGERSATSWAIGGSMGAGNVSSGWIIIRARTAAAGRRTAWGLINTESGPAAYLWSGLYLDFSTNITSLQIVAASNSIAAGSYMTVVKLRHPS
jgi:hypothetical protein